MAVSGSIKSLTTLLKNGIHSPVISPMLSQIRAVSKHVCPTSISSSQAKALQSENCILVDEDDTILGSASKWDSHIWDPTTQKCPLHRAFSVFLFNTKGELLIQQRSNEKITFPGYITNTCCSHPLYTEEMINGTAGVKFAAKKRLNFELGIPVDQIEERDLIYITRILYDGKVEGSQFSEHEIDYILLMQKDVTLHPNPEEVKHTEYISLKEFPEYLKYLKTQNIPITPWFRIISQNLLLNWWNNLTNLEEFIDHHEIHKFKN